MADRLNPYDDLAVIGSIGSPNGRSTLVMQGDGNLVLYRSGGKARWATATDGKVVSQAVMQGDGNFVMYGPGGEYIWDTATDGHAGAYLVVQDDGNVVIYDSAGSPLWATNTSITSKAVRGFLPSTSGFHFSNSTFPSVPDLRINILGQEIAIGDASKGLCGGMVFAARDYFEAGMAIPPDTTNPSSGVLFDFIVRRLFDSFNLLLPPPPPPVPPFIFFTPTPPFGPGPLTYMWLMDPALPDHETVASNTNFAPHGRAWVMINDEWPKVQADINSGHVSPVALVEVKSLDPTQMGHNHQVLAYGYDLDGGDLAIRIYDPNYPDDDTLVLSLSIADPQHTTPVVHSAGDTVWCFFRPVYVPVLPHPVLATGPTASGDHMQAGEVLNANQSITSANGRYVLIYQGDGNLVLYDGGTPLWASGTNGRSVGVCIMQGDGNLVVYDSMAQPVWSSDTWQHPGSRLVVQDDGNAVIYRLDGTPVWATNTWVPIGPSAQGDDMQAGEVLNPSQAITSASGRYRFVYQNDGNLVLYDGNTPLWASGTDGRPVGVCSMQSDGNLVIYGRGGQPIWSSDTWQHPGSRLLAQDDGNVVIYRPDSTPVWASNTVQA